MSSAGSNRRPASSISAATVSGSIRLGVPPPKKIEVSRRRPSLLGLPFQLAAQRGAEAGLRDALPHVRVEVAIRALGQTERPVDIERQGSIAGDIGCPPAKPAVRWSACAPHCWPPGHPDTITQFPAGTRTAADAAAAVGCTVAQIAKSIVFRCGMRAVVVITSGANRVDQAKADAALGVKLGRADADWVRQTTGFAIGGVAPVGHVSPPMLLLDEDLLELDPVWAAAGSPSHVFRTSAAELVRISGAKVAW